MGTQKYQTEIEVLFHKSPVVSYTSIEKLVKNKKKVKQYVKQLVRNLILKGKIKPLSKGYYTAFNEVSLAVFCFQPAYFGLQDALSEQGLWEQETIPIIITARKIRTGLRKILGMNVLIRRIEPRYYFGIEEYQRDDFALPYSDLEKTLIDLVHFKEKISPGVLREFKKRIDTQKLNRYLKKYPRKIKEKVRNLVD